MKRFLAMLIISALLFSCSTTGGEGVPVPEEVRDIPVTVEAGNEKEAVIETVVVRDDTLPGPVAERPEREKKAEAGSGEVKTAAAAVPEEKPVKEEPQVPQLTGRELANEITSRIERENSGEPAPEEKPQAEVAPHEEEAPASEEKPAVPSVPEPAAEESADTLIENENAAEAPSDEKEETVAVRAETAPGAEPEKEAEAPVPERTVTEQPQGPLDHEMSEGVFSAIVKLVIITVLFTLASVIRSKYNMPLPWPVSLVLSVLLASVPMLTSSILEGWSLWQLSYLSILLTFFVFRQKNRK